MSVPAKSGVAGQPSLRLVTPEGGAAVVPGTASGPAPLTPEHLGLLREAEKRAKKIRRAAGVAAFGGWSAAIFAVLSAALSITDPVGLALAAALGFIAYHEMKGRVELLRFEPKATKRLALNQLFFATIIVAYGAWKLAGVLNGSGLPGQTSSGNAEVDQMMQDVSADMQPMIRMAFLALYGGVIAVGVLVPGLTAIYYHSRRGLVQNFLKTTPPWVVDLMRTRV